MYALISLLSIIGILLSLVGGIIWLLCSLSEPLRRTKIVERKRYGLKSGLLPSSYAAHLARDEENALRNPPCVKWAIVALSAGAIVILFAILLDKFMM
jgi:hypothetical protein